MSQILEWKKLLSNGSTIMDGIFKLLDRHDGKFEFILGGMDNNVI